MTKIFYALFILLILFFISIVTAVNSSIVIEKIAKEFAPDYNLSYERISGNVFTGIKIDKLKYDNQTIAKDIIYKWDPISLLQKKISIDQIDIKDADIDVIKSLIASFDVDESDDNTTDTFSFDVGVDNISISLNPFKEEGVAFEKTVLRAEDVTYFSRGEIEVKNLSLEVDSNLTKFSFKGNMKGKELTIDTLVIESLDTRMLENIIAKLTDADNLKKTEEKEKPDTLANPLIPQKIVLKHFDGSLQTRDYMGMHIDLFHTKIDDLKVDMQKIAHNKENALHIGNLELQIESNLTDIDLQAQLIDEKVLIEYLGLKDVDTLAIEQLFMPNREENSTTVQKKSVKKDTNLLIPRTIELKKLQANMLPRAYDPLQIDDLVLHAEALEFDVDRVLVKHAKVDLNTTSNLAILSYSGEIKDNYLLGKASLRPQTYLFEHYDLPLRKESINNIEIDLNASKQRVKAEITTKAKQLLKGEKEDFNLDIESLRSLLVYDLQTKQLHVDSRAAVNTPYANDIALSNHFVMENEKIAYKGEVNTSSLRGFDAKYTKILEALCITYSGDAKRIKADILSKQLKGTFESKDFKKADLHLETRNPVTLSQYVELPETLSKAQLNAVVDVPIDFNRTIPVNAKVMVESNVLNMDVDVVYGERIQVKAKTTLPKDSLLRDFNKEINWDGMTPLDVAVDVAQKNVTLKLFSKAVGADINYAMQSDKLKGKITLGGLVATVSGVTKKSLKIESKISSMKSLKKSIASVYKIEELPPLEGSANISATLTEMKKLKLSLASPKLVYKADRKTKHIINDIKLNASLESSKIVIDSYSLTYNKQKYFSTKPSQVSIDGDRLTVETLWLNDALNVNGTYNLKTQQGMFNTKASKLPLNHEYVDLESVVDLKTIVDGNSTSVNGKITLLGGHIKYDIAQKTFASDSDIIIVQEMRKKKASPFMDNLSTNIQIETKKPLILKQGAINIRLKPDLGINKAAHSPLLVLGSVELLKGGSYTFEGKKFILEKSFIHFTGDPNKPLLEIKVKHRAVNHLITLNISGTPDAPEIAFSSSPTLTKEQILSVILFDTEAGGDTHSGDEMMKMMGGAMAKSALNDLGIKLDHLVLGEGNSIEVGKKLTNKMTVIYINGTIPKVKLKYRHGEHTESIIGVSEESQSYDIIYKGDF